MIFGPQGDTHIGLVFAMDFRSESFLVGGIDVVAYPGEDASDS